MWQKNKIIALLQISYQHAPSTYILCDSKSRCRKNRNKRTRIKQTSPSLRNARQTSTFVSRICRNCLSGCLAHFCLVVNFLKFSLWLSCYELYYRTVGPLTSGAECALTQ